MGKRRRSVPFVVTGVTAAALCLAPGTAPAAHKSTSSSKGKLPPGALRGPIDRLRQYPKLSLASREQRAAAAVFWKATRVATRAWTNPGAAVAAGFTVRRAGRGFGDAPSLWLHAEHRRYSNDDLYVDPHHPEVIIYANLPRKPLVLIGVMYGMKRDMRGPTFGGPITRWHTHWICARGTRRASGPRPDGSCPPGTHGRQARNEMLHVWLTRDLRSAYAVTPPEPELCVARLLPADYCRHVGHSGHHH